jgi:anti-sigma regulatory factor (Ser/Thr protein kinase)
MKKQSKPAKAETRVKNGQTTGPGRKDGVGGQDAYAARKNGTGPDAADRDGIWKGEFAAAACLDGLDAVQDFVGGYAERLNLSDQALMHVALAVEEIFVNIASYAYASGEAGIAAVRCEADAGAGRLTVVFEDSGAPYNPLERPDPDISLPLEERPVGGLGIFMTKRLMDAVDYRFEAGRNILTIVKRADVL